MTTPRFQHPALDDLNRVLDDIEAAEQLLKEAKERLPEVIAALPSKIGNNEDLRDAVVHHLYWFDDRVPILPLKHAFQVQVSAHAKKNGIEKILRNAYLEIICVRCGETFRKEATSRDALKREQSRVGSKWGQVCGDCYARELEGYSQQYQQQQEERAIRAQYLHTMPYAEYLQTPEWQERRKRAMKKAGFRCQVCNAYGVRLNTHHRTYERRGFEEDRDLITLCEGCHQIFHDNGSLARVGGEQ